MGSLQDAISNISSEKATDRSLGLSQYREIFENDNNLDKLGKGEDGDKKWLRVVQGLFNCVVTERSACLRKGAYDQAAPTSKKRLQDSAATVLWLTERAGQRFGSKALISTVNHITNMLVFRAHLFEPIAAMYLKALHLLLSFKPHVHHLDAEMWSHCLTMSFNAILDVEICQQVDFDDACAEAKRHSSSTSSKSNGRTRSTRPEDVEASRCILALIQSDYAPLLGPEQIGSVAMIRIASVLLAFPIETSLHLPIVEAAQILAATMVVNRPAVAQRFAELSWHRLLSLWGTRGQALKEQVQLLQRAITPVLIMSERFALLRALYDRIRAEAEDRISAYPLDIEAVELRSSSQIRPFQYDHLRLCARSSDADIRAWSTLENAADVIVAMHLGDTGEDEDEQEDAPSKRQRLNDGSANKDKQRANLSQLCEALSSKGKAFTEKLWSLQILTFVVLRCSEQLSLHDQQEIISALLRSGDENATLRQWSFVALTACTSFASFVEHAGRAWHLASRQTVQSTTSRAAYLLLGALVRRRFLSRTDLCTGIETLIDTLKGQGSFVLSDSLTTLLVEVMRYAKQDVELSKHGYEHQVIRWLTYWSSNSISGFQTVQPMLRSEDVANLLVIACDCHQVEIVAPPLRLAVTSATSKWTYTHFQGLNAENFVLSAELKDDEYSREHFQVVSDHRLAPGEAKLRTASPIEQRCMNIMKEAGELALKTLEADRAESKINESTLVSAIRIGLAALYLHAVLHDIGVSLDEGDIAACFSLLTTCVEATHWSEVSRSSTAAVIELVSSCFYSTATSTRDAWTLRSDSDEDANTVHGTAPDSPSISQSLSLQALWQDDAALPLIRAVEAIFEKLLKLGTHSVNGQGDDADTSWTEGRNVEEDGALRVLSEACLSILCPLSTAAISPSQAHSRPATELTTLIVQQDTSSFLSLATFMIRQATGESLVGDLSTQEALTDRIGSGLLATYEFERDVDGHQLAIAFLRLGSRAREWNLLEDDESCERLVQLCDFFIQQDKLRNLHRSVSVALADYLLELVHKAPGLPVSMKPESVTKAVFQLCRGPDVRAQFHAAALVRQIFCVPSDLVGSTPVQLYVQLQDYLPKAAKDRSEMVMRILILGNACVAHIRLRSRALFHIVETCMTEGATQRCGRSVIAMIAKCVDVKDCKLLWSYHAADIVRALVMNSYDIERVPFHLFQFSNQKEWGRITTQVCAPVLLNDNNDAHLATLQLLCNMAGRSVEAVVMDSMPATLAHMLMTASDVKTAIVQFSDLIEFNSSKAELMQAIKLRLDEIVVNILQHWHEDDSKGVHDYVCIRTTLQPSDFASGGSIPNHLNGLSRGTKEICAIIDNVLDAFSKVDRSALALNVIHQMGKIISEKSTVGTHRTLCLALQIFCAHEWHLIKQSAMLQRLVLQTLTSILTFSQTSVADLHPLLDALLGLPCPTIDGYLALLVRLASQLDLLIAKRTSEKRFEQWFASIESTLIDALTDAELRGDAIAAMCAWPRQTGAEVTEILGQFYMDDFDRSLRTIAELNYSFLDRCRTMLMDSTEEDRQLFSATTLWSIVDLLKQRSGHTDGAADVSVVLADILFYCSGQIRTPQVKVLQEPRRRMDLITAVRTIDRSSRVPTMPLRSWIIVRLLEMTKSHDLAEAQDALRTVRLMHAHDPSFAGNLDRSKDEFALATKLNILEDSWPTKRLREDLQGHEAVAQTADHAKWTVWLCTLLCGLLNTREPSRPYLHLADFVRDRPEAAATFLPAVIHILFRTGLGKDPETKRDATMLSKHLLDALRREDADPKIWQSIIGVVLQLRQDTPSDEPFAAEKWIEGLDFLLLARRAVCVHLHASALLFVELQDHQNSVRDESTDAMRRELLYTIYDKIGDPDSFYGVKNGDANDALMRTLHHEHRWREIFELEAARHETLKDRRPTKAITDALQSQGFDRLALDISASSVPDYEAAWKARKWDMPINETGDGSRSQDLFIALRSLHEDLDPALSDRILRRGYMRVVEELKSVNVEANRNAMDVISDLLCLREIRQWIDGNHETYGSGSAFDFELYERLQSVQLSLLRASSGRFNGDLTQMYNVEELEAAFSREGLLLFELGRRALEENEVQVAANAIVQAQHRLAAVDVVERRQRVEEEFANVLWAQGHHAMALNSLESSMLKISSGTDDASAKRRKGSALIRLGQWRATARSHQARSIMTECYEPALKLFSSCKAASELADGLYRYGIFADEQYRLLNGSTEVQELRTAVKLRQEEIRLLNVEIDMPSQTTAREGKKGVSRAKDRAQQILKLDMSALKQHDTARETSRRTAAECFVKHLSIAAEQNNDALMRFTALWFESAEIEAFNDQLLPLLKKVPSWKFLPLARQLCSRITRECPGYHDDIEQSVKQSAISFQKGVFDVVVRCAAEHPFHAFTPLYALARGNDDSEKPKLRSSESRSSSQKTLQWARSEMAQEVIASALSQSRHRERIAQLQAVYDACVEWAQFDVGKALPKEVSQRSGTAVRIPNHLKLVKLRKLDVPVLTDKLAIDVTSAYNDITAIARYAEHFTTAGGVHLPKISSCIGSDGKVYRQLFKDRDDLRQDAVMQQVFALVNELLGRDRRACKRHLYVRTYSVLPLGPRYGLLEYVGNTVPLLNAVMSAYDKHSRTGDVTPKEARVIISKLQGASVDERRKGFQDVCEKMPPLFHFYFLDRYTVPMALLQARLNYTRSVATSSIVGHMLGLGDRHGSNILLDQRTGEVCHIDFGVAFDQGRLLPIPELVPFRLTRNVIDGMGLNGIEGVFRHGCQETLRILRSSASMIKTVLEVFRFDPLYDWTLNPIKLIQAQGFDDLGAEGNNGRTSDVNFARYVGGGGGGGVRSRTSNGRGGGGGEMTRTPSNRVDARAPGNDVAELQAVRAINSVMDKLSDRLSVEYTVNDLMIRAMDVTNLATIFHGWQAAL